MQVENVIVLFQFQKIDYDNKKQKSKTKLFVRLFQTQKGIKLLNSEIYENETFKENAEKEIWKNFSQNDFLFFNGTFYDSYENKLSERIIQCSSICLLKNGMSLDDNWFEISISQNRITLSNQNKTVILDYDKELNNARIVSANVMLLEHHTQILVDAILKLKNTFIFTDLFLNFLPNTFQLSNAIDLFNAFFDRPFSRSTFKRRFSNKVQPLNASDNNNLLYTKT